MLPLPKKRIRLGINGYWNFSYITDNTQAVYILYGLDKVVLYVGHTERLLSRLQSHLRKYKSEIIAIDYITKDNLCAGDTGMRELEKILYYLLEPKYCKKKIIPETIYHVKL